MPTLGDRVENCGPPPGLRVHGPEFIPQPQSCRVEAPRPPAGVQNSRSRQASSALQAGAERSRRRPLPAPTSPPVAPGSRPSPRARRSRAPAGGHPLPPPESRPARSRAELRERRPTEPRARCAHRPPGQAPAARCHRLPGTATRGEPRRRRGLTCRPSAAITSRRPPRLRRRKQPPRSAASAPLGPPLPHSPVRRFRPPPRKRCCAGSAFRRGPPRPCPALGGPGPRRGGRGLSGVCLCSASAADEQLLPHAFGSCYFKIPLKSRGERKPRLKPAASRVWSYCPGERASPKHLHRGVDTRQSEKKRRPR